MKNKRVLVAMSGGVDSSVAASLLKEEGYEVIGATMKVWPKEQCLSEKDKSCCSLKDIEDAKKVCDQLDIKHYVLNFEKVFKEEVIDYFSKEYLKGRTPNPCIICNEKVKFGSLLKKAQELEGGYVATGHYARIEQGETPKLREGVDSSKDQSYVLCSLKKEQLKRSLFPVGSFKKSEIKEKAKELGLSLFSKPESQEICFVLDNNYSNFLKEYCGVEPKEGNIIDGSGKILGKHNGFWNFTIGQRKGLGIGYKEPLYVINIDPDKNKITVGVSGEVRKKKFIVKDLNWLDKEDEDFFEAEVKIRYNTPKRMASVRKIEDKRREVTFIDGEEAITPGQAACFYDGEYVIGGGWIERVEG
ncbi:MAG: tRNA 2-thiouridine(34) synthase MnmA [Candidatus Omnitrophota bacterium]